MVRATTPTILLRVDRTVDFRMADEIYITYSQVTASVTKRVGDPGVELIVDTLPLWPDVAMYLQCKLTQEETMLFSEHEPVSVQVNWTQGDSRYATKVAFVDLHKNLMPRVIS